MSSARSPVILVTGGAGYIGSHMVLDLARAGYRTVTLDNLSSGHRRLVQHGDFIDGDVNDSAGLQDIFSRYHIDAVMHFAASSLVGESLHRPRHYWQNNVDGTACLIGAMQRSGTRHLIFSSTAAVYGEPEQLPLTELHPCKPVTPYGNSKLAAERLLQEQAGEHGMSWYILRYFNAAGADAGGTTGELHEPETHLVPRVLQVASGRQDHVTVYGSDYPTPDGTCIRDYVHVSDITSAHLLALQALLEGGESAVCNLGNSTGYSVREVIETARTVTGHAIPDRPGDRRSGDPAVLVADSTRARSQLGWRPRYEQLEAIISSAWQWEQNRERA